MTSYRNRHRTLGDIELGHHLATLRVARGYTQAEVAESLTERTGARWTQVALSNIERGRTPCTVSQWVNLTDLYGIADTVPASAREHMTTPCVDLPDDDMPRPRVEP